MLRSPGYTAINILGLSAGLAVALLLGLWVNYQYSYDRFLPGSNRVYQVRNRFTSNGEIRTLPAVCLPMAGVLKKDIPGIRYTARSDWMGDHDLKAGEKKLYISGGMVGKDFLKIFSFPMLQGNAGECLEDMYSIVLTRSTAMALFGTVNAMGRMVRLDNQHDLQVTGILQDLPGNSTLNFHFLVPFAYKVATVSWIKDALQSWDYNSWQTFVSLKPGVSYSQIKPMLKNIFRKYDPKTFKAVQAEVFFQPMTHWHLFSQFKHGVESGGFIMYVRMFTIIGILVLIIACINFMNLSTARSEKRAREVGVRKAIGSGRVDLIFQFLLESALITTMAFGVALGIVILALPYFNILTSSEIRIPYSNPAFWGVMAAMIGITSLLAGARPAFYLSSFRPVRVLNGVIHTGKTGTHLRQILVVLQFSCSVALIIGTLIVYKQIQFARDRPKGYNPNRLMVTDASPDLSRNYEALRNELMGSGVVSDVTAASSPPTEIDEWDGIISWSGQYPGETLGMAVVKISGDYFRTLGMNLVMGRKFSGSLGQDSLNVILNEAAVKRLRYRQPLNQEITWGNNQRIRVIGVVRDALMLSPFADAEPTFFRYDPGEALSCILYRLSPAMNTREAISKLTPIFNKYNPAYPYIYRFVDHSYANKFKLETLIGKLAALFAGLAILISCLGLFGLTAFMAEQRSKEISIRKVLGATVSQVWFLLSRDFVVLVTISCLLASPVAWYFLHRWLLQYVYRISIGPWVFLVAGCMALLITILTVSIQSIKAAMSRPVKGLRAE